MHFVVFVARKALGLIALDTVRWFDATKVDFGCENDIKLTMLRHLNVQLEMLLIAAYNF